MLKIKLIYFTLFMVFQQSSFFSQLSNTKLDRQGGYWSIASQYGHTFQTSDVDSERSGWGTGISLAKNLYFNPYAFLSLDLRSRLFFGSSKGLDDKPNHSISANEVLNGQVLYNYTDSDDPGFIFDNYKNSFVDLGLEANVLLNKYRLTQGWYANLFGGAGLGIYNTRMNLADDSGDYASRFASVNLNDSPKEIKKNLRAIMDDSYESQASGFTGGGSVRIGWMPSIGMEIGYDINRYLTAYMGHRSVFSRTDRLDANHLSDPSNNDVLNFTHLGLQINFQKTRKNSYSSYNSSQFMTYDAAADGLESGYPQVGIIQPEIDWFKTSSSEIEVIASLENVYSVLDISCMVNGKEVAFDYNKDEVRFFAELQRGTNVLKVQVRNEKGEARDIKRVVYTPVTNDKKPDAANTPVIELVSPETSKYYALEDIFTIQAYLENVDTKEDISLTANGMDLTSFKYDATLGQLTLKVRLAKGKNSFMLTAYNPYGKTFQEFAVYYGVEPDHSDEDVIGDPPQKDTADPDPIDNNTKPFITILSPLENPYYTKNETVILQAEMHGISSKEDIVFTVNGRPNYFFEFDKNNKILKDEIHLMELNTVVVLETKNEFGTATKSFTILYGDKPADSVKDPAKENKIIEFTEIGKPDQDCFANYSVRIRANIQKEDITLKLNDFEVRNFRFNEEEGIMLFSLYLDEGKNSISVNVELPDKTEYATYTAYCGDGPVGEEGTEVVDTSPAAILSVDPKTGFTSEEKDIILRIRTAHVDESESILVFLNDEIVDKVEFDLYKSEALVMLSLLPKYNVITIRVSNDYGNDELELDYFYDEPFRTVPSIIINAPRNGFSTDDDELVFRASVDYIKSIENVKVLLNGSAFPDFNYNEEYGKIQGYIPLRLGANTLEVIAENKLGQSSEKVTFHYRLEHVPAVEITGPKEGLEYRKAFAMLYGVVQNMPDKRGIGIQINGVPFKSINYDKENDQVSSRVRLDKGMNEIILSAKNEYGFASDTIHLYYKGVPEKPSITFIYPATDDGRSSGSLYNFEAEVLEISHSSQVELTVNGKNIEEIYYYKDEGILRAEIPLRKGKNQIILVATNDTGVATAKTSVYYE